MRCQIIDSINCKNSFDLINITKAQQGLTLEDNKSKAFELGNNLQFFARLAPPIFDLLC